MNKKKKVLIFGVTGQDGSNLVEYLLTLNEDIIIYGESLGTGVATHLSQNKNAYCDAQMTSHLALT